MEVLKLMNSNPNWRDVLSTEPYNITIKEDGSYDTEMVYYYDKFCKDEGK